MRQYTIFYSGEGGFLTSLKHHNSGGHRALHVLKNELTQRGCYANTYTDDNIVIYPEVVYDQPLKSPFIVRWLLNKGSFPELSFGWTEELGVSNLLTVNIVETDIFYPRHNQRKGTAYWIGKGASEFNPSLLPPDSIHITPWFPSTRPELANLLSSIDYLISFDGFSCINLEATMLGTPVVCLDKRWSKESCAKSTFKSKGAVASIDDLPLARAEVAQSYDDYLKLLPIFSDRIDKFIEISQQHYYEESIKIQRNVKMNLPVKQKARRRAGYPIYLPNPRKQNHC